jgi:natural product precursor
MERKLTEIAKSNKTYYFMKKISLRGISEILSAKELRNVVGGSDPDPGDKEPCSKWCYYGTCCFTKLQSCIDSVPSEYCTYDFEIDMWC